MEFSLLGGPLYRIGCRLGLVREATNTTPLGLVLGASLWIVLLVLALVEGLGPVLFSIAAISANVQLLVAIPLFFVCEASVDPRATAFVQEIVRSEVVPVSERPTLESEIARIARWRDSSVPEGCLFLAALLLALTTPHQNLFLEFSGLTGQSSPGSVGETTWTSHWYWIVCMTLFRFLLLRWLWRLAMWSFFLWRVSRLDLRLIPSHPDRAGGLGYLPLVQTNFWSLVFAMSAAQSASLAPQIAAGRITLDSVYPFVAFMLFADAVLFIGPVCVFSGKLSSCKVKGISDYFTLAERYVSAFERKWLGKGPAAAEPLLGTADIQSLSLADLSNSVGVVREMSAVPVSLSLLISLAVAVLLPLLPLLLLKYSLGDLFAKFIGLLAAM